MYVLKIEIEFIFSTCIKNFFFFLHFCMITTTRTTHTCTRTAKSRVKWPKMFRIGTKIIVSPT